MKLFLTCLLATTVLLGQESGTIAASEEQRLTLNECIDRAFQQHPSLVVARARLSAAEAKNTEARSALLPQLRLSSRAAQLSRVPDTISLPFIGTQTLFPSITHSYSARLSLQQAVFSGFRLARNVDIAEYQVSAASEELVRDRTELELNVTVAYWNLYRAIKFEQVIAQSVTQLTERVREIRNFANQGLATEGDVLKVQAQRSDIQLRHVETQSAIRLAAMSLNSMTGAPLETTTVPADVPEVSSPSGSSENLSILIQQSKRQRPELRAIIHRQSMSQAGVDAARGGWLPQVMLNANYDYARPNQRIIPPKDQWDGSWDVGISLQWNIWDWSATSAQTAQAEAALSQTRASVAQLEDVVALDVAQQYFKRKEAQEKISVAEDGLKQATESHRITSEKFKQGLVTNSEMLDAETALLQARISHTQAMIDFVLAVARLKKAIGL